MGPYEEKKEKPRNTNKQTNSFQFAIDISFELVNGFVMYLISPSPTSISLSNKEFTLEIRLAFWFLQKPILQKKSLLKQQPLVSENHVDGPIRLLLWTIFFRAMGRKWRKNLAVRLKCSQVSYQF